MFQAALLETMNTACAMALGAVDLHRVDAEGAVAGDGHHLAVGVQQRRRHGVGRAHAQAAEGAGVEVVARLQPHAREAEQVAAVGDGDGVGRQRLAQRAEDAVGVHVAVLAGRHGWPWPRRGARRA